MHVTASAEYVIDPSSTDCRDQNRLYIGVQDLRIWVEASGTLGKCLCRIRKASMNGSP